MTHQKDKSSHYILFRVIIFSLGLALLGCQKNHVNEITVGVILPLTGPTGYLGESEMAGLQLAIDSWKMAHSQCPKFIFEDCQGKPDKAVSAAKKLYEVNSSKVIVVTTTGPVLAVLPAMSMADKSPLVIAQCMVPGVTKGLPYAIRIYPTTDEETDVLAKYTQRMGYKQVGVYFVRTRSGEEANNYFQKKIEAFGATLTMAESFAFGELDHRNILTKFQNKQIEAILVYGYSTNFPAIYKQMEELKMTMPVISNIDMALGGMEDKVSKDFLKRIVFPSPQFYYAKDDSLAKAFNAQVKGAGKEPNYDMAYMYDMTNILLKAIQLSSDGTPANINKNIIGLMPYRGVTGTIQLTADRDTKVEMKLVHWTENGIELVETIKDSLNESK
jgi:branched-chain amino acid transport system substrate-binding protein